jgi:hypothetical protein
MQSRETVEHLLLRCTFYERERRDLFQAIEAEVGGEVWRDSAGDPEERMALLLGSGRESTGEVTNYTKQFLSRVWRKREQKLTEGE